MKQACAQFATPLAKCGVLNSQIRYYMDLYPPTFATSHPKTDLLVYCEPVVPRLQEKNTAL
jgi:hypothetical protein